MHFIIACVNTCKYSYAFICMAHTHTHVLSWWPTAALLSVWVVWTRWKREGLTPGLPKGKRRRKRDRENRRWRRDRHLSSRCLVVYVIQRREWNVFWTWGSVTTGRIVTEITFSLDSRGRRKRLSLLCVCTCTLAICHLVLVITQTHPHMWTLGLFLRNFSRVLLYSINHWWPPVKTCPVTVCVREVLMGQNETGWTSHQHNKRLIVMVIFKLHKIIIMLSGFKHEKCTNACFPNKHVGWFYTHDKNF